MIKQKNKIEHILVLCGQGLGNTLLVVPMLAALRKQFPKVKISVIVWGNGSDAVLQGLSTIDELYVMPIGKSRLKTLFTWAKRLRSMKISHCIVAWPPGIFSAFLALFSGASVRIGHTLGYCPVISYLFFTDIIEYKHKIHHDLERNLELAEEFGVKFVFPDSLKMEIAPLDIQFANEFLKQHLHNSSRILFGLVPGSGRSQTFKRWPVDCFVSLGNQLISDFNGEVILFIGLDEENLVNDIVKDMKHAPVVVRNKTIHQVAAIMSKCRVIIANDSGLMHVAVAAGVSTVAVVGPTDSKRTRPYGSKNRIATLNLPCSPCYDHFQPKFRCKRNPPFECLRALRPNIVLSQVSDILQKEGSILV